MNAYDFDKTIYRHDCTVWFYLWCVRRYPAILRRLPRLLTSLLRYKAGKISKHVYMECFYEYLFDVPDPLREAERFWDGQIDKVQPWYLRLRQPDDVIISASPDFLVRPVARRLGVQRVLASPLNPQSGKYEGERCHGEGKVRALRSAYPQAQIEAFYSDSLSDAPMADMARHAYLVHGKNIKAWPGQGDAERIGQA